MKMIVFLLFFAVSVQAQEPCSVIFPEQVSNQTYSVWVINKDHIPSNLFWIYRVSFGTTTITCTELGLYDNGSLTYEVRKVIDTLEPNEVSPGYRRDWGIVENISIIIGIRPNPPTEFSRRPIGQS